MYKCPEPILPKDGLCCPERCCNPIPPCCVNIIPVVPKCCLGPCRPAPPCPPEPPVDPRCSPHPCCNGKGAYNLSPMTMISQNGLEPYPGINAAMYREITLPKKPKKGGRDRLGIEGKCFCRGFKKCGNVMLEAEEYDRRRRMNILNSGQ